MREFSKIVILATVCVALTGALECYTGYSVVKGQTSGSRTEKCTKDSDQCYKAKADINLISKLKLAGCSTFRCMASRNKCMTQQIAGQTVEFCCCNDADLCNGPKPNLVNSAKNKIKDIFTGGSGGLGNIFG